MPKMKHTSDPKHGGFSQGETSLVPDKKGQIDVPDQLIDLAFSHGFAYASDDDDEKLEKPAAATSLKK